MRSRAAGAISTWRSRRATSARSAGVRPWPVSESGGGVPAIPQSIRGRRDGSRLTLSETARIFPSMPIEIIDNSMMEPHVQRTAGAAVPQAPEPEVHNTAARLAALGAETMPAAEHFRREHFPAPEIDPHAWRLVLGGLVETPAILALADLMALPARTLPVVLECAGPPPRRARPGRARSAVGGRRGVRGALDGRPPARPARACAGSTRGHARSSSRAPTAARSRATDAATPTDARSRCARRSTPTPCSPTRWTARRSRPSTAGPCARSCPGWYATDSVKWLDRIQVTADEFGGPFQAIDYRFATADDPGPGTRMERVPVHSLVTAPAAGAP